MDKCNFLRQKKQVNINGEWVDTRSYRYIPLRDAGDKSLIVINGGKPNDDYLLRTYYADRKRWEYLITTDNNGNKIYDAKDHEIVGIFNVAKEEDRKRCESVQLFNCEIKSISGYYTHNNIGSYEHVLDIQTEGSIDTKALKIYCSTLIDYGNHDWDKSYGNFRKGKFDEIYLEPSAISGLTFMKGMFEACENLKSLDTSNWNSHFVTDMSYMFYCCSGLTSLNLSGLETSHVENMDYMFSGCYSLESLDLSNFNTVSLSSVTHMFDMHQVYYGFEESYTKLTSLNLSGWNTSNVDKMDYMFKSCSALTSLDVSSFDTSDVKTMTGMFEYCSGLISLDLSNFNTHWVHDMSRMFNMVLYDGSIHTNLASLDLSGWNLDELYKNGTKNMFDGCIELKTIRMVGCNDNTIRIIRAALDSAGILDQVTIIT